jgi:formylglycine-generating enzyme required for sulfatase activity/serine/threonine protein kinase
MGNPNLTGQKLGQYELREILGVGGMGAVYRGYQANLKRYVAVKVLSQLTQQRDALERFNREAETSAALEHPNIIHIYDYGTQRGISYLVMQLLSGGSLAERVAQHAESDQPLPSLGEVAELLKRLGSALDYAHSKGVIHRDIKPSNVMFDNHGTPYLVDFGIAKLAQVTSGLTASGVVIGTWNYMAPEQWRAEELTAATDQYALAVMAYALVTGVMPFEAPTPAGIMHKHLNEMPTPPHVHRADVPQAVTNVLERAMAKRATERFPTCVAFAQAFERAIQGNVGTGTNYFTAPLKHKPIPAGITPGYAVTATRPIYRHPVVWGLGAAVLVLIIAVSFLLLGGEKPTPPATTGVPEVAGITTPTASDVPTVSITRPSLPEPTVTVAPRVTPTLTSSPPTFIRVMTNTTTSTLTPSWTPSPSRTTTLSAAEQEMTVQAQKAAEQTLTATWWTATLTPSATLTPTLTATFTATSSSTATSTATPTDTATWTATTSPTAAPTTTPSETPTPTRTYTSTAAAAPTEAAVPTPTVTWTPSPTSTDTPTATSTETPTVTRTPSPTSTDTPTPLPTSTATPEPTPTPTITPTTAPAAPPAVYGVVSPGVNVNLRDGPATTYNVVDTLSPGTLMLVLDEQDDWYQIQTETGVGWIFSDLLEIVQTPNNNSDWTPVIKDFDHVQMVLVPPGCFMMGSEIGTDDEKPAHEVCFDEPFWIDRTEVTNGQFAALNGQAAKSSYFYGDQRPREQIAWNEAQAFCESRVARLPSEAEWEYAARGPDGLEYPWGNEWDGSRVIWDRSPNEGTAPVGSLLAGASWVGSVDMSGNVWEWVADWYDAGYYGMLADGVIDPTGPASGEYRGVRGGSWRYLVTNFLRAAYRGGSTPDIGIYLGGFRCARSAEETPVVSEN